MVRDVRDIAEHVRRSPSRRWDHVPTGEDMMKALCASALQKSVAIVELEMPDAIIHQEYEAFLAYCLESASHEGGHCEFGVYAGSSINLLADKRPTRVFDGFDSFRGLPAAWTGFQQFDFDRKGALPKVRENVRLHVGLFDITLPAYVQSCGLVTFLHIDCDLYSSTACVFKHLGPFLAPGCVIVFDEYFAYPGFEHHERKAFAEYLKNSGRTAKWIACCGPRAACVLG